MSKIKIVDIGKNVSGVYIKNDNLKTNRISVNLLLPLDKDTVSANALLPFILGHASKEYPDYSRLNAKLAELYGAELTAEVKKNGDVLMMRLTITALNDKYALENEQVTSQCTRLLISMIFDPPFVNNSFNEDDFANEKRLFVERISSEINDKIRYAAMRCESIMCNGDPYSVPKYGTLEQAQALTPADMYKAWQNALKKAYMRINVIGETDPNIIFDDFAMAFKKVERENSQELTNSALKPAAEIKDVTERLDIQQGKMSMGFIIDSPNESEAIALRVMTDLFGGGPYSRLFMNVREKLSLCYYCSASLNRRKGFIMVNAGVEESKFKATQDEILRQLEIVKEGLFEVSELESSKMALINAANSINDSESAIENWYTDRMFETALSPKEYAELVGQMSKDEIIKVANKVKLSTIYKLAGKEVQ